MLDVPAFGDGYQTDAANPISTCNRFAVVLLALPELFSFHLRNHQPIAQQTKGGRQTDIFSTPSTNTNSTSGGGNGNGTENRNNSSTSNGISPGAIAGIVVGIIALLTSLSLIFYFCFYRRRHKREKDGERRNPAEIIEPFMAPKATDPQATSTPPSSSFTTFHGSKASQRTNGSNQPFSSSSSPPSLPPSSTSGRVPAGTKVQRKMERQMVVERQAERLGISEPPEPVERTGQVQVSERHVDGGPVDEGVLQRRGSGRLPPAYGDIPR
ncbi:hypothetical protein PM082_016535 [Marasmius tenuissimus]|nr:hypothetical protein PM082_016535 [Marasmius tenuissimus]